MNGEPARLNSKVKPGDKIEVFLPESFDDCGKVCNIAPSGAAVPVLYEDEDFVVMDKPAGMTVHPSRAHVYDTLANAFASLYPDIVFRPLTRLDADTTGTVLIAKNKLVASIDRSGILKVYYGITDRAVTEPEGTIDACIERETEFLPKRTVRGDGRRAVTRYWKICEKNGFSLLRFVIETGRTHQIRVHCAYKGFPLCGDQLYGGNTEVIARQALHVAEISFLNPLSGKKVTVRSALPEDMRGLIFRAQSS